MPFWAKKTEIQGRNAYFEEALNLQIQGKI
jgi:hypothetical protein